jgi:hypothetical protein
MEQESKDEIGCICNTKGGEEEFVYCISGQVRRKETTRKTKK